MSYTLSKKNRSMVSGRLNQTSTSSKPASSRRKRIGRKISGKALEASVSPGSGNVFADLGLQNPTELLAKAQLANAICSHIRQNKLTQVQAAAKLGIDQPKISALMRGKLNGFSMERLVQFLASLGYRIKVSFEQVENR